MFKYVLISVLQICIVIGIYIYYSNIREYRCVCKRYKITFPLAKASAWLINLCTCLSLISIIRFPKRYFYIRLKSVHIICSVLLCVWSIIHSVSHYIHFVRIKNSLLTTINITGVMLLCLLCLMLLISLPYIRRLKYNIFLYSHYILFMVYIIVLLVHGNLCFIKNDYSQCPKYTSWIWLLVPMIYMCVYTLYKFKNKVKIISVLNCGNNIIELGVDLSKEYAGKTIWVCCPSISYLEWHPFTVIMNDNKCFIYYKIRGDWTKELYDILMSNSLNKGQINLLVEGPYYALPKNIFNIILKKPVVLISSGIGVTSFINVFKKLIDENLSIKKLNIILIMRYENEIQWLLPLVNKINNKRNVDIRFYFTSKINKKMLDYVEIPYSFGRPDFKDIYFKVSKDTNIYYSGKTRVGREIGKCFREHKYYCV
jgi:hypothetical protein